MTEKELWLKLNVCAEQIFGELLENYTDPTQTGWEDSSWQLFCAKKAWILLGDHKDATLNEQKAYLWIVDLLRFYYESELREMGWQPEDPEAFSKLTNRLAHAEQF